VVLVLVVVLKDRSQIFSKSAIYFAFLLFLTEKKSKVNSYFLILTFMSQFYGVVFDVTCLNCVHFHPGIGVSLASAGLDATILNHFPCSKFEQGCIGGIRGYTPYTNPPIIWPALFERYYREFRVHYRGIPAIHISYSCLIQSLHVA